MEAAAGVRFLMQVSGPLAVVFLAVIGYLVGIAMLRHGRWRGINHRQCVACGYDLTGLGPRRTAPCPECGVQLTSRTVAWAMGRQQRSPMNAAGVIVSCLSSIVLAFAVALLLIRLAINA